LTDNDHGLIPSTSPKASNGSQTTTTTAAGVQANGWFAKQEVNQSKKQLFFKCQPSDAILTSNVKSLPLRSPSC
jgi:hypothetical protein